MIILVGSDLKTQCSNIKWVKMVALANLKLRTKDSLKATKCIRVKLVNSLRRLYLNMRLGEK
tara:strand:- start:849 stop:1034 length:186 start_codon:yes stop_codon:yes gene_type:complete